jgi:hypothetical protein
VETLTDAERFLRKPADEQDEVFVTSQARGEDGAVLRSGHGQIYI